MAKKATKPSKATHSGELKIGEQTIPCYVLEDGTRVITQRGLQRSVGMSMSGGTAGAHRMSRFVANLESKGVKAKELALRIDKPILFYPPKTGRVGYGYEASILPEICEFILRCRDADILTSQQQHIAIQSDVLMRALAHVGIIALVDEATGYQYDRARKALEKILEDFIAKELVKWAKRFPDEFYEQMFRLRGWPYDPSSVRRPGVVGKYTNDIIYERLAPGVLEELRRKNPPNQKGNRRHKHHQWLTEDVGHQKLQEHLSAVLALMRASANWSRFRRLLERALPRHDDTGFLFPGPSEELTQENQVAEAEDR